MYQLLILDLSSNKYDVHMKGTLEECLTNIREFGAPGIMDGLIIVHDRPEQDLIDDTGWEPNDAE